MTRIVEAVMFDAAGTLLRVEPSVGHVYADEASKHGARIAPDSLNQAFRTCWKHHRTSPENGTPFHTSEVIERAWWRRLVWDVFQEVQAPPALMEGFDGFFDGLYERFAGPEDWRLYQDAIPTLDALSRKGIRLAVVSNWDSRLPRLLDAMGVADRFEFVITSAEAGVSKPHPGIFQCALARLHLDPSAVVHVGDSEEEDMAGAREAGLWAVFVNRGNDAAPEPGTIRSLTELPQLIAP